MARVPEVGDRLTSEDVEMIYEAIVSRQANFPGEPMIMSMSFVLMNIGSRWMSVRCVGEEHWTGLALDVVKTDGNPTCPNGHELEKGEPLRLFWLTPDTDVTFIKFKPEEVSDAKQNSIDKSE